MAPLGNRLESAFTVHTLDLPGFGRSGKPRMRYEPSLLIDAIVELARHAVPTPILLVGSGLSAGYAVEAAARLGSLADGVVLLGPPEARWDTAPPILGDLLYQVLRSPVGEMYHHLHANSLWRRHALRSSLAVEPLDLEERAGDLGRYAAQPGAEWALWSLWSGDLTWDPLPTLSRLRTPALVLWGAESRGDPAAPETYRVMRPDLDQRVVVGSARWPHVDDPDAVAREILAWWRTAVGTGSTSAG
jgi:pimeloyl-ACP methyl ester carboxylesterase